MILKKQISILMIATLSMCCKQSLNLSAANFNALKNVSILIDTPKRHALKNAEIVFCLDATGSMSGLIGTAKEKIWDIVNGMAQDGDIENLKIGMVFYRDVGDAFITKQIALTTDLDDAYTELLKINAAGGGDTPESVNQGLQEAITDMKWSTDQNTYRTVFVVGDCPPHMDYQNDVKYTESCKIAAQKGITINTIKLGNACLESIPHFKAMSSCTNGKFLRLDQHAQDIVIATPYDDEINRLSRNIDNSRMYYGTKSQRENNYEKKAKSLAVYDSGSSTANSARASFKQSKAGQNSAYGSQEIIKDYESGELDLENVTEDKLPKELKGKSLEEKKQIVKTLSDKRKADNKALNALLIKKRDYLNKKSKENNSQPSFSNEVLKILKEQANNKSS